MKNVIKRIIRSYFDLVEFLFEASSEDDIADGRFLFGNLEKYYVNINFHQNGSNIAKISKFNVAV